MKARIGVILIVAAFLTSLTYYLLLFAFPVFIVGAILVWLSNKNLRTKLGWTVAPVVLWYPGFATLMYLSGTIGSATAQKFDFIFDKDFEGRVVVVGDISCGQKVTIKNGREQLSIPKNGILLYQGEVEVGYVNHKYYRKSANGKLEELPERANYMYFDSEPNPPPTNVVGVWLGGTGNHTVYVPEPQIEYKSMRLTVTSADSISKYFDFHYLNEVDSITDNLVRECKKKEKLHPTKPKAN